MANRLAWLGYVFAALLAWSTSSLADQNPGEYTIIYQSAWRNGIDPRLTMQEPLPDSISTVSMPQFGGVVLKASMLLADYIDHIASGVPRVELVFAPVARFAIGNEYEVSWSTIIPANYQLDSQQPEIITQVHQSSDQGSPPFALMLAGQQYQVDVRGGAGTPSRSFEFGAPAADEGKVVTWLLNYRPDDTGASAVTDLYKDGVLIVQAVGYPNVYPGEQNGYFKIGIYKWWWLTRPSDVTQRTMYYGDVEISGRPANQDLAVDWSDPQMGALASTYAASYAFDWQTGIDTIIGIQRSNPADITVVGDPITIGRKAVRVSITPGENFASARAVFLKQR
jgi:Polysaccharide lyase